MILTVRTLVILLAAAVATGGAVLGVSKMLSGSALDNGTDHGLDTNGNGKFDWLVVEATVALPEAGTWDLSAGLFSLSAPPGGPCGGPYPVPLQFSMPLQPALMDAPAMEWPIAWSYERYFFIAGDASLRVAFSGTDIFRTGVNGPYVVRATMSLGGYVRMYDGYGPMPWPGGSMVMWNHTTKAYGASDFEEPFRPAYFMGGHSDVPMDTDHDGLYDFLELRADVHVNTAGTYNLNGYLSSTSRGLIQDPTAPELIYEQPVAYAYRDVSLTPGDASVFLRFRGDQIRTSQVDGPWNFSLTLYGPTDTVYMNGTVRPTPIVGGEPGLTLPPADGSFAPMPIVYPETLCGVTSAYPASAFDDTVELLSYTGNLEDVAQDWDRNGLYESLTIRAEVDVAVRAGFNVDGTLRSADGAKDIAYASSQAYLPEGVSWVDVMFPGPTIRASGIDGPYQVAISITPAAGGYDPTTTYVTRAYHATDFEAGYVNRTAYWISDFGVRASGSSSLAVYFNIVRGEDFLTYVIEDIVTTTVVDASGTTVWSVMDKVYLPSSGSVQSFGYSVDNLAPGTYTIVVTLGPADRPVDQQSITTTL